MQVRFNANLNIYTDVPRMYLFFFFAPLLILSAFRSKGKPKTMRCLHGSTDWPKVTWMNHMLLHTRRAAKKGRVYAYGQGLTSILKSWEETAVKHYNIYIVEIR